MDLEKMQSLRAEFLERPENSWMPKYPFVPGETVVDLGGVLKTASRLIVEAGCDCDTPEHFEKLDKIMRVLMPDKYESA